MSLHDDIKQTIRKHLESNALAQAITLSPTAVAISVQREFANDESLEPHIRYTSLEHLKHIARAVLSGRYGADSDENDAHQGDLFSGQLQDRYPVPAKRGEEPGYKQREHLSHSEAAWNARQLRKSASARLAHADALDAWNEGRRLDGVANA